VYGSSLAAVRRTVSIQADVVVELLGGGAAGEAEAAAGARM
jgi:hypothetical protein